MREETFRILAAGQISSNDVRKTGLNNNDLIIGPSGAGKTRGYVLPNILQANESIVVADVKNSLRRKAEPFLRMKGYHVIGLDFNDFRSSYGYNPLDYVRYSPEQDTYYEPDILTVAACLVPVESKREPFWDYAARMFLECLIAYVLECLPDEEHNLTSVVTLFREMGGGKFDHLMMELGELNPESFAFQRFDMFKNTVKADRMYSSIIGILAAKLSGVSFSGTQEMFCQPNRIRIEEIGKKKTAVFVEVSDTDRAFDGLATLFFTQVLHVLCKIADQNFPEQRLDVPVRLIMDDFATNVKIPDFDQPISAIRSRGISVSLIIQSISQLESLYGHERAITIINNCDTCLYLGGQDVETARYIAAKANKTATTILNMPLDRSWLFRRGREPEMVGKYQLESHKNYAKLL